MKRMFTLVLAGIVIMGGISWVQAADPLDEFEKGAFKEILSQADKNKDGKLSVSECKVIFKNPAEANKNCTFWDANKDGIITEDEYVAQARSMRKIN